LEVGLLRIALGDRYDAFGCAVDFKLANYSIPTGHPADYNPNDLHCGWRLDTLFLTSWFNLPVGWFSAYELIRMNKPTDVVLRLGKETPSRS
jgi:hypothetical protein